MSDIFVVSAPSGTGKTTLTQMLTKAYEDVVISVSHTTRAHRGQEQKGKSYHFIDRVTFEQMIANDEFIEYALVYGHYYGTCKAEVDTLLAKGHDVILEVDYQGARQIKTQYPGAVTIFIFPPSMQALERRLICRQEDPLKSIEKRLKSAHNELSHSSDVFKPLLDFQRFP